MRDSRNSGTLLSLAVVIDKSLTRRSQLLRRQGPGVWAAAEGRVHRGIVRARERVAVAGRNRDDRVEEGAACNLRPEMQCNRLPLNPRSRGRKYSGRSGAWNRWSEGRGPRGCGSPFSIDSDVCGRAVCRAEPGAAALHVPRESSFCVDIDCHAC